MFRVFYFGIFCGALAAAGLAWSVPAVDQHREPSLISVEPNGGNREVFRINLPYDRILAGTAGSETVPPGLEWPAADALAGAQAELFKIRDVRDVVIGVASRMAGAGAAAGPVIEWTLHLPARGSLYAIMEAATGSGDYRNGSLRAGTREFADLRGTLTERHFEVRETAANGLEAVSRIELVTTLVSKVEPAE